MTEGSDRPRHVPIKQGFFARQVIDIAADFFFPPCCIGCGRAGNLFCSDCQEELLPAEAYSDPNIEVRATALYEGVMKTAIHALKYHHQPRMAIPLACRLADSFKPTGWQPTLMTAAPASRQKDRGYNQAALLAKHLAVSINVPFFPEAIQKIRETRPQVGLSAAERQTNVAGAFRADPARVGNHEVLIIDDVFTTGATLRACAAALLAAGARRVRGLAVASAGQRPDLTSQ